VISTAYGVLLDKDHEISLSSGSDAAHAAWFDMVDLPPLAFDHEQIIRTALLTLGLEKPLK
jgi:8-oxo-dGTP diphosphatase